MEEKGNVRDSHFPSMGPWKIIKCVGCIDTSRPFPSLKKRELQNLIAFFFGLGGNKERGKKKKEPEDSLPKKKD